MSISTHHYQCSWPLRFQEHLTKGSISKVPFSGYPCSDSLCRGVGLLNVGYHQSSRKWGPIFSAGVNDSMSPDDSDETDNNKCHNSEMGGVNSEFLRENLEKIVGMDDSKFSGIDLATLIRDKYGRSYDVQLIKKRSFPLSEEEYILRLDDIANTLKCWGAVSHIRNSLAKSKERPRIGKAVSIFIDMDESGARANEWIYK
ncbi:uncharacterized protein LOC129311093 isoform X2 [Prosopis cineraria]|uniref:uncharacterized protein LOC129311093 isoform X2 n=1 Tax=Prosopis cineraria TaxID=364024 RepID=UPI0024105B73|nr:uncharacterized protein LOC129311093 isoform X2 [Prosopis cineraria]